MSATANNLQGVRQRIRTAVEAAQRASDTVELIAVTKTFPASRVLEAMDAGQFAFGENYVQEAVAKILEVEAMLTTQSASHGSPRSGPVLEADVDRHNCSVASPPPAGPQLRPAQWHFIGPIQSNKTQAVATHFDWVHSVDRLKIAERLSAQRDPEREPLNILLEVNLDGEPTKSGVSPHELHALARAVAGLPRLRLRGLMTVPEPSADPMAQRAAFARLRVLGEQLRASGLTCDQLSMGMSADLEAAIAEGATIVRVGTAIFGPRLPRRIEHRIELNSEEQPT